MILKQIGLRYFLKIIFLSYKVNFLTQFIWLMWRSALTVLRDPFSTNIALGQSIVSIFFYFEILPKISRSLINRNLWLSVNIRNRSSQMCFNTRIVNN